MYAVNYEHDICIKCSFMPRMYFVMSWYFCAKCMLLFPQNIISSWSHV